jgi:hypothetical protein
MKIHRPAPETGAQTIRRYGELAARGGEPADAARAWTAAGFDDEGTSAWLDARCFDPSAARELAALDILPGQAAKRTRDGRGDYVDTIGYKVANGDLTARQGAARSMSSR